MLSRCSAWKTFGGSTVSYSVSDKALGTIKASHEAANLRMTIADPDGDGLSSPIEFSWRQFWITFLYENLPPVFLSPLAALVIERSFSRAWHVCQNRRLFAVSPSHNGWDGIVFCWVLIYPASWLITTGLVLRLFSDFERVQDIDLFLMLLAYLFLFTRRLIISVKYGFFRPEDLELLGRPAPEWSADKTTRRLVGVGWSNPANFPGLIEDELAYAMEENDVNLKGIFFRAKESLIKKIEELPSSEIYPVRSHRTDAGEITAGSILHRIIHSVYSKPQPRWNRFAILISVLLITSIAMGTRSIFGLAFFGESGVETIILVAIFFGLLSGLGIIGFGLMCAFDLERRFNATNMLGDLLKYPGVSLTRLFNIPDKGKEKCFVFFDFRIRQNIFAWMNARKVLRSFGEPFYLRIQGYTSILILFSFLCILLLNLLAWAEIRHHVSTIYVLGVIILVIASISVYAMAKAIKLQSLSSMQRDFLRKKLFLLEEEIGHLRQNDLNDSSASELQSAKDLLEQVDEAISFNELTFKPTTVLGYAANPGVIGSVLGLLTSGSLFAIQGFATSDIAYDALGWFNF